MEPSDAHETQQPGLIALTTIMMLLASIALGLRCWSNALSPGHKFGYDDLFAILTLPFIIAECALIYWWISLGLGRHGDTLPPANLAESPKIIFAAAFLYDAAISLPKFSVLFFYYRIFANTNRLFFIALWVVGGMNAAWLTSAWISTIFQCIPVNAAWESVEGAHCFVQSEWFLGTAIPSMIIDFFILILPLPMLWGLQATKMRRALITGIFMCGYCVIVVSIGRLVTLAQAGPSLEDDITWSTINYIEWVQCEGPISLISVCLPNIFSLGKRAHQRTRKTSSKNTTGNSAAFPSGSADHEVEGQSLRLETYKGPDEQTSRSLISTQEAAAARSWV